jgi:gliding motility-associated-like protein
MIDFSELKVSIFNRNGELIFNFTDPNAFWNGTVLETGNIAPNGVYVFLIEIKNNSDQSFIKKGSITLLN